MNEIQLGAMYRDKLSGFIGRAYSITRYWAGCERVVLQPPVGEDGKRSRDGGTSMYAATRALGRTCRCTPGSRCG